MKKYTPARRAHSEERKMLAQFLAEEELGATYLYEPDFELIQEAVEKAVITVFVNYRKKEDLIMVAWSAEYSYLPNRFERFALNEKGIRRLPDTGRRKYHKVQE